MSHFTTVKTKITDLDALEKACINLGRKYKRATGHKGVQVRGWQGNKMEALLSINMGKYDIGVVEGDDGNYTLVADWWGIEQEGKGSETEITSELSREYAYVRVVDACEAKGYTVSRDDVQHNEDGSIQLVAVRWG